MEFVKGPTVNRAQNNVDNNFSSVTATKGGGGGGIPQSSHRSLLAVEDIASSATGRQAKQTAAKALRVYILLLSASTATCLTVELLLLYMTHCF